MPLVRRTRATLRRAELGFLGVVVKTRVHTPRRWGAPFSAGVLVLDCLDARPLRTSCSMVGTRDLWLNCGLARENCRARCRPDTTPREQAMVELRALAGQSRRGPFPGVRSGPGLDLPVALDPMVGALAVGGHRECVRRPGIEGTPPRGAATGLGEAIG